MADEVVRILSIDGGGIRGIIPAIVVNKLLGNIRAQDAFHIITGTSTGGIIASGLAKPNPMTPQEIVNLYVDKGTSIFREIDPGSGGPKYNANVLLGYLGEEFNKTRLSDINVSGTEAELLVPSYAIGLPKEKPPATLVRQCFFAVGKLGAFFWKTAQLKVNMIFDSAVSHEQRLLRRPILRPRK
jgi:hypothetical protein